MDSTSLRPDCVEPDSIEKALRTIWVAESQLEWCRNQLARRSFEVSMLRGGGHAAKAGSLMHMASGSVDIALERLRSARLMLSSARGGEDDDKQGTVEDPAG